MSDKPRPISIKAYMDQLSAEAETAPAPEARAAPRPKIATKARTISRLAAVQALYQMELAGTGAETVVKEFLDHRFQGDIEGETLADADEDYFAEIVRGVVARQAEIDRAIVKRLAQGWKLERIDSTVRAMLRAGAFELISKGAPKEVVIDEYIELAKAFFDQAEVKFLNGCLDGVARDVGA
jgi:N utilization substance protein B